MANFLISKEKEQELLKIFKVIDSNNDGEITLEELREGYNEFMNDGLFSDEIVEDILDKIDLDKNGVINYSEFITAAADLGEMITS